LQYPHDGAPRRSRALLLTFFGLAMLALLAPAVGAAAKQVKKKKNATVTVMSRNLYLGADLGPAITAAGLPQAFDAAGQIINELDASNFPERSKLLADEITAAEPDLVGLQEAALWRDQTPSDLGAPPQGVGIPATNVRYDFLALLLSDLKANGSPYKVAVVQDEFDSELPADTDQSDATGGLFGADIDGRLTMRDAILVRKGSKVKVSDPKMGQFVTRFEPNVGGIPIPVDRGWVSVDAKIKGKKRTRGAKFHFVNAHLEAFGDPTIREAQARELFAAGGPLVTKKQLIFVGDINSGSSKDRIGTPFPGDPGDPLAYNALVNDFGLTNLGARQTCCYSGVNSSTIGSYRFDHTVDHVFVKPRIRQLDAFVTGGDPTVTTPSGLVASDHGGLVSELKLKKKKK